MVNQPHGLPLDELLELAARAIVREWGPGGRIGGVTIEDARAAVAKNFVKLQRLGPELSRAEAEAYLWPDDDVVIDLADIPRQIDLTVTETESACPGG